MSDKYTYKKLEQKKNHYTFEATVNNEYQKEVQEKVFNNLAKDVKIAGFRPGKAPKEMIEKRIAVDVLNDTINKILPDIAFQILTEEKLNPISRISYDFEDFGKDGQIKFKFSFYNSPVINISDLKKIKVEVKKEPVTDAEVDIVIRNIIQSSLPKEKWEKLVEEEKKDEKEKKSEEVKPFEITDELVKELGYEDEKTAEGLRKKVKESLESVKESQGEEEFTSKVMDEAMKVVDFDIPEDVVHEEVHKREHAFMDRLKKINLELDAYLKTQNKSMEEVKEEWKKDIKKGVFTDILAINLAMQEKLIPTEEEMDKEIDKVEDKVLQVQYKGNPQMRDQLRTFMTRNNGIKKVVEIVKGESK